MLERTSYAEESEQTPQTHGCLRDGSRAPTGARHLAVTCSYLRGWEAGAESGLLSQCGCSCSGRGAGGTGEGRTRDPVLAESRALWLVSERRPALERGNTDLPCFLRSIRLRA